MKNLLFVIFPLLFCFTEAMAERDISVSDGETELTSGVSTFDFDQVFVGDSIYYVFILSNSGDANLTLNASNAVTISGTDATDFNLLSDSSGYVLAPGELIGIDISFEPGSAGTKTAILSIGTNDPDEDPFTFTITGTANAVPGDCAIPAGDFESFYNSCFPLLDLFSGKLTGNATYRAPTGWTPQWSFIFAIFGFDINVHETADAHTGSGALELSSDGTSGFGDAYIVFPCSQQPDSLKGYYKFTGAADDTAFIVVTSGGTSAWTDDNSDTLLITANAATYTELKIEIPYDAYSVDSIMLFIYTTMHGVSTILKLDDLELISSASEQPDIFVSDGSAELTSGVSTFDFDKVYAGDSVYYMFVLSNHGDANLTLNATNAVTISGADAADFTLLSDSSGHVLAPGDTIGIDMTFEPGTAGPKTATLSIDTDDPNEDPFTITLTATVLAPPDECTVPSGDFESFYNSNIPFLDWFSGAINGIATYRSPAGWNPLYSLAFAFFGLEVNVTETADAHTGSGALELFVDGAGFGDAITVFPCSMHPDSLKGYYKFTGAADDSAVIIVSSGGRGSATDANSDTLLIEADAATYTEFKIEIPYDENSVDSLLIYLITTMNGTATSFKVDDFELVLGTGVPGDIIYVDADATGNNDGTTWTDAFTDLEDALSSAIPTNAIWVAGGTYIPSTEVDFDASAGSDPREVTFQIPDAVMVYGGFAGNETNLYQRDFETNITILSGDINQDDDSGGDSTENAFHVVYFEDASDATVLDGFTITAGNADATGPTINSNGGGIYNYGNTDNSNPVVKNCSIINNSAGDKGGGVYIFYKAFDDNNISFKNCLISENSADKGGGIYNDDYGRACNPSYTGCTISNNSAANGGGIYNNKFINYPGTPVYINCRITGNQATSNGGGIYDYSKNLLSPVYTNCLVSGNYAAVNGGGLFSDVGVTNTYTAEWTNCTFSGNYAGTYGGGIYNTKASSATSNSSLVNCIFSNDDAGTYYDEIANFGGTTPSFSYCNIAGSGGSTAWNTNFGTDGGNNIDADPLFLTPYFPENAPASAGDYHLFTTSPCIDAGDNSENDESKDLAGENRIQGAAIDMGAYEGGRISSDTIFVNHAASGSNDGTTWSDAYTDLGPALSSATSGMVCWVAAGTYYPSVEVDIDNSGGSDPREVTFYIPSGVKVYGGFSGTESDLDERNIDLNETILSGDLNQDDESGGDNSENAYHVVYFRNANSLTLLNGITVTKGNANVGNNNMGGGILNDGSSQGNSNPEINRCKVMSNYAYSGGGINNYGKLGEASPKIISTIIAGNTAVNGAGIYNYGQNNGSISNPEIINCLFSGNFSSSYASGIYNYGSTNGECNPSIISCTFTGNRSQSDACIYNYGPSGECLPIIKNCILWNNSITNGSEIYNYTATPTISYCLIAHSGGSDNWNSLLGTDGGNNIDLDPLFFFPLNPEMAPITTGDYHLVKGSPAINVGDNDGISEPQDLTGEDRIQGGTIDIGAIEGGIDSSNSVIFVDKDASGNNDGSSWTDAFTDLQSALLNWKFGDQIWVTDGTYIPSLESDFDGSGGDDAREVTFKIGSRIKMYGGFSGSESSIEERDYQANITVLSGDINQDDESGGDNSENAYHVIYLKDAGNEVILDGFIIKAGHANGSNINIRGAGIYNESKTYKSSPKILNCTIENNIGTGEGGGIFNTASSGCTASPVLINCSIRGNEALTGGGIFNQANDGITNPIMINCLISGNDASNSGGGMYYYSTSSGTCIPVITNSTIAGNVHGGVYCYGLTCKPQFANSIIWYNEEYNLLIYNSAIPEFTYSNIEGSGGSDEWDTSLGLDNGNNLDAEPYFINEVVGILDPVLEGDWQLVEGSPCIDAGNNSLNSEAYDLNGDDRIQNTTIDMGPYEGGVAKQPIYVKSDATGEEDGTSWNNAFTKLQDAINHTNGTSRSDIWVAAGTYYPDEEDGGNTDIRYASFLIPDNVKVYGGFDGSESSPEERDWASNLTILSGDIKQTPADSTDDTRIIVRFENVSNETCLDGFTITRAYNEINNGGGIYVYVTSVSGTYNPTIKNCLINRNICTKNGGGIYNYSESVNAIASPVYINCKIVNNYASSGAGIYNYAYNNSECNPQFINCEIISNHATSMGGGFYNQGRDASCKPLVKNCLINSNKANSGGGMLNSEYNETSECTPEIINSIFSGNNALFGGGLYNGSSSPQLINCIIAGNSSPWGGGLYNSDIGSDPTLTNCILWNNSTQISGNIGPIPSYSYCNIQGSSEDEDGDGDSWNDNFGTDGGNNLDLDPYFLLGTEPSDAPTDEGDYHLWSLSPMIDAGDNSANPDTVDLDGMQRIQNGTIDLGPYEGSGILDTISPALSVQDISVYLDDEGEMNILAADIVLSASDNCCLADTLLSKSSFSCSDLGTDTIMVTLTDKSGNDSIREVIITVLDTLDPALTTQSVVVSLDSTGSAIISAQDVVTSAADNCSVSDTSLSQTAFGCSDLGTDTIVVTLTDGSSNHVNQQVILTVQDTLDPALTTRPFTIYLNSTGTATLSVADVTLSASDNCSLADTVLSQASFSCANLGDNVISVTLSDGSGNETAKPATVTVEDTLRPELTVQDVTIYCDASGVAEIIAGDVIVSVSDNCTIADTVFSQSSFDCSGLGVHSVTLTISDGSGNETSKDLLVTVMDILDPALITQSITLMLNATGSASISTGDVIVSASDNCSIADTILSKHDFDCSYLGIDTITVTLVDGSGNEVSEEVIISIQDTVKPVMTAQSIELYLDETGSGAAGISDILVGASDNCALADTTLSQSDFTCTNLGNNTVSVTLADGSGNENVQQVTITVLDTLDPVLAIQTAVVYLDTSGTASITAGDVVASATDNCIIADTTLSKAVFSCTDIGTDTITVTLKDGSGNEVSLDAIVTIRDTIKPEISTQPGLVILDAGGNGAISADKIILSASDNCSLADTSLSQTVFSCANLGENFITLTVTDKSGNETNVPVTITVSDTISPILTAQPATVTLDELGNASVSFAEIMLGASDNCALADTMLSQTAFNCTHLGNNIISVTLTDVSGNENVQQVTITVLDTIKPVLAIQAAVVYLDTSGTASITAGDVIASASDNCIIADTSLSKTVFSCTDIGTDTIKVTLTDGSGNEVSMDAIVSIRDTIKPEISTQPGLVILDAGGNGAISADKIILNASDNCSLADTSLSRSVFDCSDLGENFITVTVADGSGNETMSAVSITVEDTIKPVLTLQTVILTLDDQGIAKLSASDVVLNADDNCILADTSLSQTAFDCTDLGNNTVSVTLADFSGNEISLETTVTIQDTMKPVLTTKPGLVILDTEGNGTIRTADLIISVSDNCSLADTSLSRSVFDCSDLGENFVTVTVADGSGNEKMATVSITVEDTISPELTVHDLTLALDDQGTSTLKASDVVLSADDNCAIADTSLSLSSFSCSDLGENSINVLLADGSGNVTSKAVKVTVSDTTAPNIQVRNIVIEVELDGEITLVSADVDSGSFDNCTAVENLSYSLSKSSFTAADEGENIVECTVWDESGNLATSTFTVLVQIANLAPSISDQSFSIDENSENGTFIGIVAATDPEGDAVTFSAPYGIMSDAVALNTLSGELTVNNSSALDYESTSGFSFTVLATDSKGDTNSATITININNLDEEGNDAPTISGQSFSIEENSANGTSVGLIVATDPEGDAITFSITSGDSENIFLLNGSTGQLGVNNGSLLNYEADSSITLTVRASDGSLSTNASVTVHVSDVNEVPTDILLSADTISENRPVNTFVGEFSAVDEDLYDSHVYTLSEVITEMWIREDSLLTASELDYETKSEILITVKVTDSGGLEFSKLFKINILDINEGPSAVDILSSSIRVYPNPVRHELTIEIPELPASGKINLFNMNGSKVLTMEIVDLISIIKTDGLSPGNYMLLLQMDNKVYTTVVIKAN